MKQFQNFAQYVFEVGKSGATMVNKYIQIHISVVTIDIIFVRLKSAIKIQLCHINKLEEHLRIVPHLFKPETGKNSATIEIFISGASRAAINIRVSQYSSRLPSFREIENDYFTLLKVLGDEAMAYPTNGTLK